MLVTMVDEPEDSLDCRAKNNGQQQAAADQDRDEGHSRQTEPHRPCQRGNAEISPDGVERAAGEVDNLLDAENDL